MNIVLIAPPAAGKGAAAQKISKEYNIPHISTGDLLRNIKDPKIISQLKEGKLVSDELITKILKDRLQQKDCEKGYVLDGYPRNINQAKMYEKLLQETNNKTGIIIFINIPKEKAIDRMLGRRICQTCGLVYNIKTSSLKPKKNGICDKCHSKLIIRKDDNPQTYDKRFKNYEKETKPLIKYYQEKGKLYQIQSEENPEKTFNNITKIIGGAYDKH